MHAGSYACPHLQRGLARRPCCRAWSWAAKWDVVQIAVAQVIAAMVTAVAVAAVFVAGVVLLVTRCLIPHPAARCWRARGSNQLGLHEM